jgi:hypothetical protein
MAGVISPFCFEFRMRLMILGKREDLTGKGPLKFSEYIYLQAVMIERVFGL